jgi:DNA-binding beta-propeller fold protein YncE
MVSVSVRRPVLGLVVGSAFALLACALQGALGAAVAGAVVPGLVPSGEFHAEGAAGIAVDQASGDVFTAGFIGVAEEGERKGEIDLGRSEKFGASGDVLSLTSPFGGILNDGVAVNPTNGRLYVANPLSSEIDVSDPNTGELLSSFAVPAFESESERKGTGGLPIKNIVQIATDTAGNVYVPDVLENKVLEYNEKGEPQREFTGSAEHPLKRPNGVAVAVSGDVWVADTGENRIEELSPSGAFLGEFESEGVRALALDAHGDVLAIVENGADNCEPVEAPCEHLVEYSPSGARLADVGAGFYGSSTVKLGAKGEGSFQESMVAVNEATGRVYVSDGLKNTVWIYQPPLAPVLGKELAEEVGTVEAKLGAVVNPGGALTSYRFEYDTREYSPGEGPHGVSVPFPEGVVGEGFSARTVWASAKGLAPGTTYHYRVVATNGLGAVVGPDQTFTTVSAAQAVCPNEAERGGFSAALPDCRAYELVTPVTKDTIQAGGGFAATDGDRYAYRTGGDEVAPGSQSAGVEFLATRGAHGWTSEDALPRQPYTGDRCPFYTETHVVTYSRNLSKAVVLVNNFNQTYSAAEDCHGEVVEVVPGEPVSNEKLLLHDNERGTYQLINLTPVEVLPTTLSFVAASADLNVVVFEERARLIPEALNDTVNLYEWREGVLRLLKFELPSGAPVAGSLVGISDDGSEVFFTANGNLYARLNHGERTVQLDEKAPGGAGPGGGGSLAYVTADGSQVLFTDDASAGLTSDTVPGSRQNLYRYDVSTGQLSDLAPANASLAGVSEDGSYVYITSPAVLSGSQANQFGETAQEGPTNLYLQHGGTTTFLTHARGETGVSANGSFLSFSTSVDLSGYDNDGQSEIYLYSTASSRFECATCNPSGEAPTNGRENATDVSDDGQLFFATTEALLPEDTNGTNDVYEFDYYSGLHLITTGTSPREVGLNGATPSGDDVFFSTSQQLLPQDSSQEASKIYDARVNGGFPEPASPPACTTADACRSAATPQPSIYGEPASQTFSGAGNVAQIEAKPLAKPRVKALKCKKGTVKRKGKCVKKRGKQASKPARADRRDK